MTMAVVASTVAANIVNNANNNNNNNNNNDNNDNQVRTMTNYLVFNTELAELISRYVSLVLKIDLLSIH